MLPASNSISAVSDSVLKGSMKYLSQNYWPQKNPTGNMWDWQHRRVPYNMKLKDLMQGLERWLSKRMHHRMEDASGTVYTLRAHSSGYSRTLALWWVLNHFLGRCCVKNAPSYLWLVIKSWPAYGWAEDIAEDQFPSQESQEEKEVAMKQKVQKGCDDQVTKEFIRHEGTHGAVQARVRLKLQVTRGLWWEADSSEGYKRWLSAQAQGWNLRVNLTGLLSITWELGQKQIKFSCLNYSLRLHFCRTQAQFPGPIWDGT